MIKKKKKNCPPKKKLNFNQYCVMFNITKSKFLCDFSCAFPYHKKIYFVRIISWLTEKRYHK